MFDLMIPKVDRFMPLHHASLLKICVKIGSFIINIWCSQVQ